jgi:hypothetical protein
VRVPCSEGIANHTGPESCVGHREVHGEALTGETVGQPLSRESDKSVQGAVSVAEGNMAQTQRCCREYGRRWDRDGGFGWYPGRARVN